ncbi:MAG: hypothetical protein EOO65_04780 [Methanosarcinales archaeon]|nr:MAG: hypothetical protein EOO65_04780 [Methanosarcinales archaeon]
MRGCRWETWVLIIMLPLCLVFQVMFLNSALRLFDAKEAVPLYQSAVVLNGVLFGWTIFAEGSGKSGVCVCVCVCTFARAPRGCAVVQCCKLVPQKPRALLP